MIIPLFGVVCVLAAHNSLVGPPVSPPAGEYELVATVDSMGIPPVHVQNLLTQGGVVRFGLGGSRAYGVAVAKDEAKKALFLLQRDARERPFMYVWVKGVTAKLGHPDPKTWPVRRFDLTLAEIARSPVFKQDGNLRGLANKAVTEALSDYPKKRADELKPLAVVHQMRLFEMRYLGGDKIVHTGYKAEVELGFKGYPSASWTWNLYAWNDGRNVAARGGWGTGDMPAGARHGAH